MKKILNIIIPILICFLIGTTASYIQSDSIENWYPILIKPALTPPNIVFPIAWSIIYILIGISIGLILNSNIARKKYYITLFIAQLFFNFTWSISFFYLQNPILGLINIFILDMFVAIYILKTYRKWRISSYLFMPYMIWLLFATYLNGYIFIYN